MQINRHGPPFIALSPLSRSESCCLTLGSSYSYIQMNINHASDVRTMIILSFIRLFFRPRSHRTKCGRVAIRVLRVLVSNFTTLSKRGANLPPHSATVALEQAAELNLVPLNHVARSIAVSQPSVG